MSSELPPSSSSRSILPDSGPYQTFRNPEAAGLMLQAICLQRPGLVRYLRERGLNLVTPLNTATSQIGNKMFALRNDASPYMQALRDIHARESAGELPEGSVIEATSALYNGEFEETPWFRYVQAPENPSGTAPVE